MDAYGEARCDDKNGTNMTLPLNAPFINYILKMRLIIGILATVFLFTGCQTHKTTGRLDQFIITEAKLYGAASVGGKYEIALTGVWIVKRDRFGTVIECSGVGFNDLDKFLYETYGKPHRAGKNAEGKDQWVIPAKVAGVSIWYSETGKGVQITILKPDNMWH